MASGSNLNCTSDHCVLIRKQGPTLVRALPEPALLLKDKELKQSFSEVEQADILKGDSQSKRAAKFLDKLEVKPVSVFNRFITVLSSVDRSLSRRLAEVYSVRQDMQRPLENGSWIPGAPVDPGDDCGVWADDRGPANDLGCLNEGCKAFLGSRLNGSAKDRSTFQRFCRALKMDDRIVKVSLSAANPTGFIIKRLSDDPRGSLKLLEDALREIGKESLYQEMMKKV